MPGEVETGITKEFLENALQQSIVRFEAAEGSSLGDGYTCARALFKCAIWTKENPDNPRHIVIKCFPQNETRQQFLDNGSMFEVEIRYYDTIIPELNKFQEQVFPSGERIHLPFAPFLHAQYIPPSERAALGRPMRPLDNFIIMPDLRVKANGPFQVRDRFLGLDLDHFKLVIEGQATLHATSWAYKMWKEKSLTECFPFLNSRVAEAWHSFFPMINSGMNFIFPYFKNNPRVLEGLEHIKKINESAFGMYFGLDLGQTEKGHTKDNVLRVPTDPVLNEEPWNVLLHGDCWSNNLMFRYDEQTGRPTEVIFIDLQLTREAEMFSDLMYTYINPEPHLRRKHLSSLLHVYYDTFTAVCDKFKASYPPGWSFLEFHRRFRRASILAGVMTPSINIILRSGEDVEDLDKGVARKSTENSQGDAMQDMADYFSETAYVNDPHPSVLPRITAVLEDLIEDNVI